LGTFPVELEGEVDELADVTRPHGVEFVNLYRSRQWTQIFVGFVRRYFEITSAKICVLKN
jgi:hypothetical protein